MSNYIPGENYPQIFTKISCPSGGVENGEFSLVNTITEEILVSNSEVDGKTNYTDNFCNNQIITSFDDKNENIEFTLFPNPNNEIFMIKSSNSNSEDYSNSIINSTGQEVYNDHVKGNTEINIEGLTSGVYCIKLTSKLESNSIKFILL
ncbi:MAG: hypothetical protein ACJA0Q_001786 [Saprospiraceae bacterium]|jgi:hypothetical protein